MQCCLAERPNAQILPFLSQDGGPNRLTAADRIQAMQWDMSQAIHSGARVVIYDGQSGHDAEFADTVGIYRKGESWAAWWASRRGRRIMAWDGLTGCDLGIFLTMEEALDAISAASLQPRRRRA